MIANTLGGKFILLGLLTYGGYLIYKCPCDKLVGCHKYEYLATLAAAAYIIL
jgi:hypothetical protein